MQKDALLGLVRHALTVAGGAAVSAGYLAESDASAVVGAVVAIVGVIWSVIDKKGRTNA